MLAATPLFVFLPRLGSPYVSLPGLQGTGQLTNTGFLDEFNLDVLERIAEAMDLVLETKLVLSGERRRLHREADSRVVVHDENRGGLFCLSCHGP